jgi:hypothetical protein
MNLFYQAYIHFGDKVQTHTNKFHPQKVWADCGNNCSSTNAIEHNGKIVLTFPQGTPYKTINEKTEQYFINYIRTQKVEQI